MMLEGLIHHNLMYKVFHHIFARYLDERLCCFYKKFRIYIQYNPIVLQFAIVHYFWNVEEINEYTYVEDIQYNKENRMLEGLIHHNVMYKVFHHIFLRYLDERLCCFYKKFRIYIQYNRVVLQFAIVHYFWNVEETNVYTYVEVIQCNKENKMLERFTYICRRYFTTFLQDI